MDGQLLQMAQRLRRGVSLVLVALVASVLVPVPSANAVVVCDIVCENAKPGTPESVWDISGSGDETIQGFSTDISYNVGATARFKIKTDARAYSIDVYRLGWYSGKGARKVATVVPSATLPQTQPACASDPSTGLFDCGTWGVSASWQIPGDAVSGVYIANLTRKDTSGSSHITFVVRNDASRSDITFQTSDSTWHAYNTYGGSDFYSNAGTFAGTGQARAFKLSYNRPFSTRGTASGRDFLFANEFPMLQFLERNGYDISYISGLDTSRNGALLLNHKTFLSVGHDEYWSGAQRKNVETARDAGVNLAFFSGNEVYWRTRWEPSIDGTATANRTLVSYKETWSDAKVDPANEWTGTWRDPRFATKAQGGNLPENGLTGTAYMANFVDLPITVQKDEGKFRLWRNTGLAAMTGSSTALAPHTVGYESDEDLDNGARPAGLVRLSTTTGPTPEYLRDFGRVVSPGTTTHNLTLYKATSGALVFGAGTIQWAWGLSQNHDGIGAAADPRMQQATINLMADMGAQPRTLMAGRSAASVSTDTSAPTVIITSPASGSSIANGTRVTVTGTASDVGGQVAGVEVSTDGGSTWRRANGRTSWNYTYSQSGEGSAAVMARATDDSVNIGAPATNTLSVSCPCSLFGQQVPAVAATNDSSGVELGLKFQPTKNGFISGIRFYKGSTNVGTHTGSLWSSTGARLATGTFVAETASGWQTLQLPAPIEVISGTTYVVSYYAPVGNYSSTNNYFATGDYLAPPLKAVGQPLTSNGVYKGGPGFPNSSYLNTNYWVDVLFTLTDTSAPNVETRSPIAGASSVPATVKPTATFSRGIDASSLTFSLADAGGNPVAGSSTYDATARTATFTPSATLTNSASYTASIRATSAAGVPMSQPLSWTFTVARQTAPPGICPCSLWDDVTVPKVVSVDDPGSVELGVRFTAEFDGTVSGVRFYKGPQNTGTHTGSLWTSAGQLLATATFSNESTTGWQTVTFPTPVPVAEGTSYTASYRAPKGYYSADLGAFSNAGVDAPPLHSPITGAVYTYGQGAPATASNANYWVDVVYNYKDVLPIVTSTSPADGARNVESGRLLGVRFSTPLQSGTANVTLTSGGGSPVAGSGAYSSTTRTFTFSPSVALNAATTYTATVSGAKGLSGTMMAPLSWSFTTSGACPCTLFDSLAAPAQEDSGDASPIEVGTKFTSSVDGQINGMRFFKSAANTGIHVGSLWSSTGVRLASVTFSGESASGWQTASFATPVSVTAGTVYVVSYLAPNGRYAASGGFFSAGWTNGILSAPATANGVYLYGGGYPTGSHNSANYWVDPVFDLAPRILTPPTVTFRTPISGATSVSASVAPSATFSLAVDPSSIQFTVSGSGGAPVTGSVSYDVSSKTATFTPSAALSSGATLTVNVQASSKDGVAMTAAETWTFKVAESPPPVGVCPCGLWDDTTVPEVATWNDSASVELGLKFTSDVDGTITGARFYKGPQNTGTHTATLWSAGGSTLATATYAVESSTGWQTVSFASPVPVQAGTIYVLSYRSPNGYYSITANGLGSEVVKAPLRSVANGGVYGYASGFPGGTTTANFWVDPVFAR